MEKLALAVWVSLLVGTSAGIANHQRVTVFDGFPALPVPAGNTLTEAQESLRKGLAYDRRASSTHQIPCSDCQLA